MMKIFTQRLTQAIDGLPFEVVELDFDTRQKSRFRSCLNNGEVIGVDLARTGILRGGCFIATVQGDLLRVDAKAELLMQVVADSDFALLKAAYHLGNRHVPLMLTPTALYFEPDHVLAEMLQGLGLSITTVMHPFEPESGAYAKHQHDHRLAPIQAVQHVHR